jgi:uncharacterized membrane protein
MLKLLVGLFLFLGIHSLRIFADNLRSKLIADWGLKVFKLTISLLSVLGLLLIAIGYGEARLAPQEIWSPPLAMRHINLLLMLFSMILLVAAFVPGNGFKIRLRHPMILSVKVWAFAHLLANGNLADLVLFGSLLVWSVLSFRAARMRDRASMVGLMHSSGPFINLGSILTLVLGSALWLGLLMGGHLWLIGVSPLAG